ncbi:MAG: glycosyltransferase [Flavobacterium sp.]|nr:glycosyltransferase [Flavobacterium sp.]
MRILQLIDSLDAGGAERMAVNYANAILHTGLPSYMATTRKEGPLRKNLKEGVGYLFIRKKQRADLSAIFRLRSFCVKNSITHIHAHGSSYFDAVLTKFFLPKIKIIWHDHNGGRISAGSANLMVILCSLLFSHVIVVNKDLELWSKKYLFCKSVWYLPNFIILEEKSSNVKLYGQKSFRILLLANLRKPKNHKLAVLTAALIHAKFPNWSFHFVGNLFGDKYENDVRSLIKKKSLENVVFLYGRVDDVHQAIQQSDIGIITSDYEGLPVSLLELGYHGKPVISTRVGDIPNVISHGISGLLSEPGDEREFATNVEEMITNINLRKNSGERLKDYIAKYHSEISVISEYIRIVG